MKFKCYKVALTCLMLFASTLANAGLIYDESTSGDLGSFYTNQPPLTLSVGTNTILGTTSLASTTLDVDRWVFSLASGLSIDSIVFTALSFTQTNTAGSFTTFHQLFTTPPFSLSDPLYRADINSSVGVAQSIADKTPLINPTTWAEVYVVGSSGNVCTPVCTINYQIDYVVSGPSQVPEPSTLVIFTLGIIGLASRRFKK